MTHDPHVEAGVGASVGVGAGAGAGVGPRGPIPRTMTYRDCYSSDMNRYGEQFRSPVRYAGGDHRPSEWHPSHNSHPSRR